MDPEIRFILKDGKVVATSLHPFEKAEEIKLPAGEIEVNLLMSAQLHARAADLFLKQAMAIRDYGLETVMDALTRILAAHQALCEYQTACVISTQSISDMKSLRKANACVRWHGRSMKRFATGCRPPIS